MKTVFPLLALMVAAPFIFTSCTTVVETPAPTSTTTVRTERAAVTTTPTATSTATTTTRATGY